MAGSGLTCSSPPHELADHVLRQRGQIFVGRRALRGRRHEGRVARRRERTRGDSWHLGGSGFLAPGTTHPFTIAGHR
jgi:hypothetical protein